VCSSADVRRYRARVSGPLLDRIDLHVRVATVDVAKLTDGGVEESSAVVAARVERARDAQRARADAIGAPPILNAELESKRLREACVLPVGGRDLLSTALRRRGSSARALHRVMRVARTIADLEGVESVMLAHLAEAVRYRVLSEGTRSDGPRVSVEADES
jgi:magnesium chelatase family protein